MVFGLIDRYLIRCVVSGTAVVVAVLVSLGALSIFIGQQDDIGVGRYSFQDAVLHVLLNVPAQIVEFLPISTLIGTLFGLGTLARGSELAVLRTSGLSIWRIARPIAIAALLIALAGALLTEYIAPQAQTLARERKSFAKNPQMSLAGAAGAWIRDGNRIINIGSKTSTSGYGGVEIYEFEADGRLSAFSRSTSARPDDTNTWLLSQYFETRFGEGRVDSSKQARKSISLGVDDSFMGLANRSLDQLSTTAVVSLARHLALNGLDHREAAYAVWKRLARFITTIAGSMLALSLVFGPLRSSGAGLRILVGALVGIGLFAVQEIASSLVTLGGMSAAMLGLLPAALIVGVSTTLLSRVR